MVCHRGTEKIIKRHVFTLTATHRKDHLKLVKSKETLSFNNVADSDVAWAGKRAFKTRLRHSKHGNPCGVAESLDLISSYRMAYSSDPSSAFGGIVSFNGPVNEDLAKLLIEKQFLEVLLGPSFGRSFSCARN